MIYFCADDYGISKESNSRIEECLEKNITVQEMFGMDLENEIY